MTRLGFVLGVKPGCEAEYERRHQPIWPELAELLRAHGAHNYSIFLNHQTRQLFGTVEVEDLELWNAVAHTEVYRRWWVHMAPLMAAKADGSPVVEPLREVFHLG